MHKCDLVIDLQYGSTGKGLIAGYLAKRNNYDTAVCAFASNAGHSYYDKSRFDGVVMTQQLPTAITSPTVKNILLGPGSAIHADTLLGELTRYAHHMEGKRLMIHPHAAVVEDYHSDYEKRDGRTKMGSTAKGVGEAYVERIRRDPTQNNSVWNRWGGGRVIDGLPEHPLAKFVVAPYEYDNALAASDRIIIEGAQGFSLSLYHGQYPYTTSRDVTPWQVAADCGLPFKWASSIKVTGTLRTYPIRVNNRDGSSGPCYPDQSEVQWEDLGLQPELTTVTKLPRRIFTFSQQQLQEALFHCGGYWETDLFLNFANYMEQKPLMELMGQITSIAPGKYNPPRIKYLGFGPDDSDVKEF